MKIVSQDPRLIVDQTSQGYSLRFQDIIPIKATITGKFAIGVKTFYTWAEVRPLRSGGGYETLPQGRTGTTTTNYAAEINGLTTVANGTIVQLTPRLVANTALLGSGGNDIYLYEFMSPGGGGGGCTGNGGVSAVQCVGNVLYVTYGN